VRGSDPAFERPLAYARGSDPAFERPLAYARGSDPAFERPLAYARGSDPVSEPRPSGSDLLLIDMKIIVASTISPFVEGGSTFIVDWLCEALRAHGCTVECLKLPFSSNHSEMLSQMLALRLMDLSQHGDRLITIAVRMTCGARNTRTSRAHRRA
jgi:hypothetical protein